MGKNIGINISKNLSAKYSPKLLDHAKQSATDALRISPKTAEATGDLVSNRIANKTTKVSRSSPQNN